MPGNMGSLKQRPGSARRPLALNPLKSQKVLAVLAERNQAVMPVGAWVEPALPDGSEIPAHVSRGLTPTLHPVLGPKSKCSL